MIISRQLLSVVDFPNGLNKTCLNVSTQIECNLGPCAEFGNKVFEKGFNMYMDGTVVCKHLYTFNDIIKIIKDFKLSNYKYFRPQEEIERLKKRYCNDQSI
jgi:hypothetical protein